MESLAETTPPAKTKRRSMRRGGQSKVSSIKEGHAPSFDNTRIWYQAQGKGRTIIFCNGLGCSTFYWKHIHAYFKKRLPSGAL